MSGWLKVFLVIVVVLALGAAGFAFKTMLDAGEFKDLTPHQVGACRDVGGVVGSEDIVIDLPTGLAFVSSCDFRATTKGKDGRGAVFGYDLAADEPKLVNLTGGLLDQFNPHGLDLYRYPDGRLRLFVINHKKDGHFVEIFDYASGRLVHVKSVGGPLLISPNDVAAVGPESFYATNDHGSTSSLGRTLEDFLQQKKANLVYYDGQSLKVAASGFSYANGVNLSPDGRELYVAETIGRRLCVFDRDPAGGGLKLKQRIEIDSGLDNIAIDERGDIWIGAHPKLLTFIRYSGDPGRIAPSQIFRLHPNGVGGFDIDEVFLCLGEDISGSSVGAVYKDKLLIGSVHDDKFLVCELKGR